MERLNRQKHLSMALRGAIVGQHLAGLSRAQIARSLNVSVGLFISNLLRKTLSKLMFRHQPLNYG